MVNIHFDQSIINELCKKHGLKLLVLHGSYAKGTATANSDIDVGILSEAPVDFKKYSDIIDDFGGIFGDKFDPAILNTAESMICYHVALAGKPLYESKKGDFANYKIQSISRYLDTKKFRDLEKKYIKSKIGEEQA